MSRRTSDGPGRPGGPFGHRRRTLAAAELVAPCWPLLTAVLSAAHLGVHRQPPAWSATTASPQRTNPKATPAAIAAANAMRDSRSHALGRVRLGLYPIEVDGLFVGGDEDVLLATLRKPILRPSPRARDCRRAAFARVPRRTPLPTPSRRGPRLSGDNALPRPARIPVLV